MSTNEPGQPEGFDEDPISEEDVLEAIREHLGEDKETEEEIRYEDNHEIRKFLETLNVIGAEEVTDSEIAILWHQLLRNPSLVKDFTYGIIDIKTHLNFSDYPLAVTIDDLLEHATALTNPMSIRPWLIEKTAAAVESVGFDRRGYVERAFSESKNPKINPEATRFLGWLLSQRFLENINANKAEYLEKNDTEELKWPDIATLATMGVVRVLDDLRAMSKSYNSDTTVVMEAKVRYDEIISAMEGIYKTSVVLLMNRPV
jgi:hypothetical protein